MTNQMKKLRENERRYYKDASDKAKKKKKEVRQRGAGAKRQQTHYTAFIHNWQRSH